MDHESNTTSYEDRDWTWKEKRGGKGAAKVKGKRTCFLQDNVGPQGLHGRYGWTQEDKPAIVKRRGGKMLNYKGKDL